MDQIKKWWNSCTNNIEQPKQQSKVVTINIEIIDGEYNWENRTQEQRCAEETLSQYSEEMIISLFFYLITHAGSRKNFGELKFLIFFYQDIDFFDSRKLINKDGQTPMEAVIINNEYNVVLDTIELLWRNFYDFDLKNRKGTVLFTALECRNNWILRHLLGIKLRGWNINNLDNEVKNDQGLTVLDLAINTCVKDNNEKFINTLLCYGLNLSAYTWLNFEKEYIIKENNKTYALLTKYLENKDKIVDVESYYTYME